MAVRLKFPRGSTMTFLAQFVKEGSAVDVSAATLTGYLKASPSDADADALETLTVAALYPGTGIVRVTVQASATEDLPLAPEYYWQARASFASGLVVAPEAMHGPVMLTPFHRLHFTEPMTEYTPDTENDMTALANSSFVGVRTDITTAALHRAVATAGTTLPWVIVTLESGILSGWTLRTKADSGEDDDGINFRVPNDWNALSNNVVWVKSTIA